MDAKELPFLRQFFSDRRKSSLRDLFRRRFAPFAYSPDGLHGATFQIFDLKRGIPPKAEQHARLGHAASGTANGVRKALLRKAAEPTAHVAGFGTRVRGLRPSDTSQGFIDKLKNRFSLFHKRPVRFVNKTHFF